MRNMEEGAGGGPRYTRDGQAARTLGGKRDKPAGGWGRGRSKGGRLLIRTNTGPGNDATYFTGRVRKRMPKTDGVRGCPGARSAWGGTGVGVGQLSLPKENGALFGSTTGLHMIEWFEPKVDENLRVGREKGCGENGGQRRYTINIKGKIGYFAGGKGEGSRGGGEGGYADRKVVRGSLPDDASGAGGRVEGQEPRGHHE